MGQRRAGQGRDWRSMRDVRCTIQLGCASSVREFVPKIYNHVEDVRRRVGHSCITCSGGVSTLLTMVMAS